MYLDFTCSYPISMYNKDWFFTYWGVKDSSLVTTTKPLGQFGNLCTTFTRDLMSLLR